MQTLFNLNIKSLSMQHSTYNIVYVLVYVQ